MAFTTSFCSSSNSSRKGNAQTSKRKGKHKEEGEGIEEKTAEEWGRERMRGRKGKKTNVS